MHENILKQFTNNDNLHKLMEKQKSLERLTPPKPLIRKPIEDEVEEEMEEPENKKKLPDSKFITKAYKYLRKLGYVDSQYEFSEQFLNKNKYYFGMILCEERHPSIDALHNLIRNISDLNDGLTKKVYLDKLYEEGEKIITQRLFRYF